jgi:hypothetical protein
MADVIRGWDEAPGSWPLQAHLARLWLVAGTPGR